MSASEQQILARQEQLMEEARRLEAGLSQSMDRSDRWNREDEERLGKIDEELRVLDQRLQLA